MVKATYKGESRDIPYKYLRGLKGEEKKKQIRSIFKNKDRPKTRFKTKRSQWVEKYEKKYGHKITDTKFLYKNVITKAGADKIIDKGRGAYYSSGSRPNQTNESWAQARLASVIMNGPARKVDRNIWEKYNKVDKKTTRKSVRRKKTNRKKTNRKSVRRNRKYKGGAVGAAHGTWKIPKNAWVKPEELEQGETGPEQKQQETAPELQQEEQEKEEAGTELEQKQQELNRWFNEFTGRDGEINDDEFAKLIEYSLTIVTGLKKKLKQPNIPKSILQEKINEIEKYISFVKVNRLPIPEPINLYSLLMHGLGVLIKNIERKINIKKESEEIKEKKNEIKENENKIEIKEQEITKNEQIIEGKEKEIKEKKAKIEKYNEGWNKRNAEPHVNDPPEKILQRAYAVQQQEQYAAQLAELRPWMPKRDEEMASSISSRLDQEKNKLNLMLDERARSLGGGGLAVPAGPRYNSNRWLSSAQKGVRERLNKAATPLPNYEARLVEATKSALGKFGSEDPRYRALVAHLLGRTDAVQLNDKDVQKYISRTEKAGVGRRTRKKLEDDKNEVITLHKNVISLKNENLQSLMGINLLKKKNNGLLKRLIQLQNENEAVDGENNDVVKSVKKIINQIRKAQKDMENILRNLNRKKDHPRNAQGTGIISNAEDVSEMVKAKEIRAASYRGKIREKNLGDIAEAWGPGGESAEKLREKQDRMDQEAIMAQGLSNEQKPEEGPFCVSPADISSFNIKKPTEDNLSMEDFDVKLQCADEHIGKAEANVCKEGGEEYNITSDCHLPGNEYDTEWRPPKNGQPPLPAGAARAGRGDLGERARLVVKEKL